MGQLDGAISQFGLIFICDSIEKEIRRNGIN